MYFNKSSRINDKLYFKIQLKLIQNRSNMVKFTFEFVI